jgi:hypothetical protein
MKLIELLKQEEAALPETIRMLFPKLTEEDFNKVEALNTLLHSPRPYENLYVFENIVLALNGEVPDFSVMQGCTPEQIFFAFHIIERLGFTPYFDWEVKQWVKFSLNQEGVFFYPKLADTGEGLDLDNVKKKADEGPFPLGETFEDIQASKWLAIDLYINKMIAKEVWNSLNQG